MLTLKNNVAESKTALSLKNHIYGALTLINNVAESKSALTLKQIWSYDHKQCSKALGTKVIDLQAGRFRVARLIAGKGELDEDEAKLVIQPQFARYSKSKYPELVLNHTRDHYIQTQLIFLDAFSGAFSLAPRVQIFGRNLDVIDRARQAAGDLKQSLVPYSCKGVVDKDQLWQTFIQGIEFLRNSIAVNELVLRPMDTELDQALSLDIMSSFDMVNGIFYLYILWDLLQVQPDPLRHEILQAKIAARGCEKIFASVMITLDHVQPLLGRIDSDTAQGLHAIIAGYASRPPHRGEVYARIAQIEL